MTTILFHKAAELFPLMDNARFAELVKDIQANGLHHKIVLHDGKVLDGRNRYRACIEAKVEPTFIDYHGDPFAYAWSANGQRRDLSVDQRYLIWRETTVKSAAWQAKQAKAVVLANTKRSKAQKGIPKSEKQRVATSCGRTFHAGAEAKAAASHTNRGTVERMDRLATRRPDLAKEVMSGAKKPTEALRLMRKDEVAAKVAALPAGQFRVLYADPPWDYNNEHDIAGYTKVAATEHYPVMSLSEICSLDVKSLAASDSVLLLWATSPLLAQAFEVIKAWGFTYKTHFVWYKRRGTFGHYHKANCELLLIGTRGSCVPDADERADQMQNFARGCHSQKPEDWRTLIDRLWVHGPRLELFRRGNAPKGWAVWGAEVEDAA